MLYFGRKQLKQQAKRDVSPGIYYLSRYYLFYSRPFQLLISYNPSQTTQVLIIQFEFIYTNGTKTFVTCL